MHPDLERHGQRQTAQIPDLESRLRGTPGGNHRSGIGGEREDDIEELIMGHDDELTIEELEEILNEEHQKTQRNMSPSE
ncbi:hypothetical protein TNCV_4555531 [Trichonephila clavipes]|nr:hypothetical protein TNCV_4555531 [Trichonephila clavipes]